MVRFEDILFWIMIFATIAVALWLLHGSPTDTNAVITVVAFVATSEMLLWKTLFKIDKRTSISFVKVKSGIEKLGNNINNKLINIENLIKR